MKKYINEILLCLYLFMFSFSKIFIAYFPNYSFYILLFPCIVIVLTSILYNFKKRTFYINKNVMFITIFVIFLFLFSILLNNNNFIMVRLYEFVIYGLITTYLISKVEDFDFFIKISANLSIINFLIYFGDPFNDYFAFGDYMSFGLTCMLPIFSFCCIARKKFKNKLYFLFEILTLFEILFFCNRGAFLTAIVLEFVVLFLNKDYKNKIYKNLFKFIVICSIGILIYINLNSILLKLIDFLEKINFNSYSIKAFSKMLLNDSIGLSGRDIIWKNAIDFFYNSPIFGNGIGAFETTYNVYTHNIIFEILTSFGIIGICVFAIIVLKALLKLFMNKYIDKYFYTLIIIVGLVPLMFSIYSFKWPYFWMFIYIALKNEENSRSIIEKN